MNELLQKIESWEKCYSYPFENQEDLIPERVDYKSLKDLAVSAFDLIIDIKKELKL